MAAVMRAFVLALALVMMPAPAIPLAPLAGKTAGLKPELVKRLHSMSAHFSRTVVVTSGCRTPATNRGAKRSYHLRCMAADVRLKGVSDRQVVSYWRRSGGGTGTYCSGAPAHVDIGPTRTWHWPCRRKKGKRR